MKRSSTLLVAGALGAALAWSPRLVAISPGLIAEPVDRPVARQTVGLKVSLGKSQRFGNGLGLAVAFDGSRLRFVGVQSPYEPGKLAFSERAEADVDDIDGNSSTDQLVRLTWVELGGSWKGAQDGAVLGNLIFERTAGTPRQETVAASLVSLSSEPGASFDTVRIGLRYGANEVTVPAEPARSVPPGVRLTEREAAAATGLCSLDVDGNGRFDALTDGILIVRYLFGFSGSTLTANAVGVGATRTTPEAITAFLAGSDCVAMLDIDSTRTLDALTDGILAVRYLFGFTGSTLVQGATGVAAGRSAPDEIVTAYQAYRFPRAILIPPTALTAGQTVTDANGDVRVTAVGANVNISIVQGTDATGNRQLKFTKTGSGTIQVLLPSLPLATPSGGTGAMAALAKPSPIGTDATDVVLYSWPPWPAHPTQKWWFLCGHNNRLPESRQGYSQPTNLPDSCWYGWDNVTATQVDASQVFSACGIDDETCLTGSAKGPVLFIHGFSAFGTFGGGTGTWGDLPKLVKDAGYLPFEFRWKTNARFDDVAVDLRDAVDQIAKKTGKKVHVVAHSFGGVLVRTMMQRPAAEGRGQAPDLVASIATLGSPHSGILPAAGCVASMAMPRGRDIDPLIDACYSLTCHQAGEQVWGAGATRDLYELGDPGELPKRLAETAATQLPAVEWKALVGLYVGPDGKFASGDGLISYQGERFLPEWTVSGSCPGGTVSSQIQPLNTSGFTLGSAKIFEEILGFAGDGRPSAAPPAATDPGATSGYVHNDHEWWWVVPASSALHTRLEAAVDCPVATGCTHSTYQALLNGSTSWLESHTAAAVLTSTLNVHMVIIDGVTTVPVPGVQVAVRQSSGAVLAAGTTDSVGNISLVMPFYPNAMHLVEYLKTGYRPGSSSFATSATAALTPNDLGAKPIFQNDAMGVGTVTGIVTNALTGAIVTGAAYNLRRTDQAVPLRTGTTNASGVYSEANVPANNYYVELSKTGFLPATKEFAIAASATTNGAVAMTPVLAGGQMRIVLEWGLDPRDLDSHLYKYNSAGALEYHIYYLAKQGTNGDNLDLDNQYSYGPETTTIQAVDPTARYVFGVYHYAGSGSIWTSPTKVTVYSSSGSVVFNAPANGTGYDWKVFQLINGQITPCTTSCFTLPLPVGGGEPEALKEGPGSL